VQLKENAVLLVYDYIQHRNLIKECIKNYITYGTKQERSTEKRNALKITKETK